VVFGSHAKSAAGKNSDIDLIIVSESFRRKDLFKRADMIGKAYDETMTKFMIPMDIIMETPEEFNPDFGVVVYAA
jgi:predicted nucleotidyltransferase